MRRQFLTLTGPPGPLLEHTHNVTFLPIGLHVQADEELYPYGRSGRPGSLLDIALGNGLAIEHPCYGGAACGRCVVKVLEGSENLTPPEAAEIQQLRSAGFSCPTCRLACCAVVLGDVTVRLPDQAS